MDLSEIAGNVADQERGRELELVHPVTGEPTGLRFRVAGPDSETQNRARLRLADDLAEMADADGRVSAEQREKARNACLARCLLGWEIVEDGERLAFTHRNAIRLLGMASWMRAQIDAFAGDRRAFMEDF